MSNFVQPDYRIPTVPIDAKGNALGTVSVIVEGINNPLGITAPIVKYVQPKSVKDLPAGYATPSGQ
jgi:hypothetical protein